MQKTLKSCKQAAKCKTYPSFYLFANGFDCYETTFLSFRSFSSEMPLTVKTILALQFL